VIHLDAPFTFTQLLLLKPQTVPPCPTSSARMARRVLQALACAAALSKALGIKVGDKLPDVKFDLGFPPEAVPLKKICAGRKIVVVGLPGAFTPT